MCGLTICKENRKTKSSYWLKRTGTYSLELKITAWGEYPGAGWRGCVIYWRWGLTEGLLSRGSGVIAFHRSWSEICGHRCSSHWITEFCCFHVRTCVSEALQRNDTAGGVGVRLKMRLSISSHRSAAAKTLVVFLPAPLLVFQGHIYWK